MVIFHKISEMFFQNNLISAEIMKKRWKSPNWRILASFLKKLGISADNLIFTRNSRLLTKSQRKCDYFRNKIHKIVCHDPQIRSIFVIFWFALISGENRPMKVEGPNMRRKWRIRGWCGLRSQWFHSSFAFGSCSRLIINYKQIIISGVTKSKISFLGFPAGDWRPSRGDLPVGFPTGKKKSRNSLIFARDFLSRRAREHKIMITKMNTRRPRRETPKMRF